MKKYILIFFAMMLTISMSAQNKITVKGTVLDETGAPLIGAGVIEKGTSNGVVTDIDGRYSIEVKADGVLTFSFISYSTQNVDVAGRANIDVTMEPDKNLLNEVVVIGYGTIKKSDLTGSVASVSSKALEKFRTGSVLEALGGQVAGVSVTAADGTPGAGYDIKIRGVGTANGDASPLYIVDGFEVDDINFIASQDIHSIEYLKDASASAIYGARAANGVVLVTTKSGREGAPQVTYNGSASYRVLSRKLETLTPYDFVSLQLEVYPEYAATYFNTGTDENGNPYKYQSLEDYRNLPADEYVDWQSEAFRPTWSQSHDVSIRGGNKTAQYTVSFSHFDENGIFANSGYKKDNARVKLSQKITNWLTFTGSLNYTNYNRSGIGTGGSQLANLLRYRPVGGLKVTAHDLRHLAYDPTAEEDNSFDSNMINPIIQAENTDYIRKGEQWIGNAQLTAQIIKGLTFKTSATYNANYGRRDAFYHDRLTSQAYRAGGPWGESTMTKDVRWQNTNTLNYKKVFNKKHNLDAMIGHEVSFKGTESLYGQSKDFPFDNLGNDNLGLGGTPSAVQTSRAESLRLSFFARAFYGYADKYMLTATVRADASTVFSPKHKWGFFPSFSAAWNMKKESWMEYIDEISMFKIRAGWGIVGNDRISNYLSMDLYSLNKYADGNHQEIVLTPKQIANYDLKWEGSTTTNIGLDLGFFDSRLNITADAFIKDTKDLLIAQNLAYVTGFGSQWQNVGKIRNSGIELSINSVNFNNRNFFWTTDFNISFVKNKLVSLRDGTSYMQSRSGFSSNFTEYDYISYVGSSLGDMYGYVYDGVYQSSDFVVTPDGEWILKSGVADMSPRGITPEPGVIRYKDITGDGKITTEDRTSIGNGYPLFYGGLTNNFQFYGFDVSIMFQYSIGNDVYNATRMYTTMSDIRRGNTLAEVADRWRENNASTKVHSAEGYIKYDISSRFIEDASYLRLKNITLGYTLPENLTRTFYVSKLRIYASAQNLFCLTNYSGYDPEVNTLSSPLMPGFDWGAYPKSNVYTFGVELQF